MKKVIALVLTLGVMAGLLSGCGRTTAGNGRRADAGRLNIVTTIFPAYDWVRQLLGERGRDAELTMLLDSGVDLHSYQPTAEDIVRISGCDLFLYVGGESDQWVEDVLKKADNPHMRAINLLDLLGDAAKTEEARPGMQDEESHSHGCFRFADSDVRDRSLTDWSGAWQSVYPVLRDGTLEAVLAKRAETGHKTAEEVRRLYETGCQTEVERIVIDGEAGTMEFVRNGVSSKGVYRYKGYQICDCEPGKRSVRYLFEAAQGGPTPRYVELSDYGIGPGKAEHFRIYAGNDGFEALSRETEHRLTYYPSDMSGEEMVGEVLEHEQKQYDEHVWLSLKNARILCEKIAAVLGEVDPEHRAVYQGNAAVYLEKLAALDRSYQSVVDGAHGRTVLFADRFPFRYLADDYGLNYYAAFSGCSAESEASFETVAFLVNKADELGLPCVLTIEGQRHKLAETIVRDTGEKTKQILTMDSMQAVTAADVTNGATYLSVMEQNLRVLQRALG